MSPSAVPIFGLVRDFLLCPHKANYGKATLPPVLHEASLIRTINSLTRKEGALLTSSSLQRAPPPLNPFTISTPGLWRGLPFNMNSGRDLSFSGTSSCLYKAYCKKVLTYLKVTRSGSLCLYPMSPFIVCVLNPRPSFKSLYPPVWEKKPASLHRLNDVLRCSPYFKFLGITFKIKSPQRKKAQGSKHTLYTR